VIESNLRTGAATFAATTGKQYPDTPIMMAATSVQYTTGPFMANLQGKYTGVRYTSLVNDAQIPGFTTIDLNLAYRLADRYGFKNPTFRVNMSNLFDRTYLLANQGSGSSFTTSGAGASLYVGAPRFISASFQVDY
jgi:iron complex outermembrane receptor protein